MIPDVFIGDGEHRSYGFLRKVVEDRIGCGLLGGYGICSGPALGEGSGCPIKDNGFSRHSYMVWRWEINSYEQ